MIFGGGGGGGGDRKRGRRVWGERDGGRGEGERGRRRVSVSMDSIRIQHVMHLFMHVQ